jgi:uncharacterized protein YsxB (DUF464 family)
MITVVVETSQQSISSLEISGHAQSGPKGYDLVCAAASSIATGALNALDDMHPNQCLLTLTSEPAHIKIEVIQDSEALQAHLQFILIQLKTLENAHPKHIRIKE